MDLALAIHNIYNVLLKDVPEDKMAFLKREYDYFKVEKLGRVNLEIKFVDKIHIPEQSLCLIENLFYKDGCFYLNFSGAIISFPVKDIDKDAISVSAEKPISPWMVFYVIEKMLHIKVLEHGFCFFHAAGVVEKAKALIYASSQGSGKTKWLLGRIKNGASFLGDDLVLVKRSGEAFGYSRGLNIHIFHGLYYRRLIWRNLSISSIVKNISLLLLKMLYVTPIFSQGFKKRIGESVKYRSTSRVSIKEIFPEAKIIDRCRIDKIILAAAGDQNLANSAMNGNFIRKTVKFLLSSTDFERMSHIRSYFDAFYANGDETSLKVKAYLARLIKKEIKTAYKVIKRCKIEQVCPPA